MIWFEPVFEVEKLCPEARTDEVAVWHVEHGWFYHVWEYPAGKIIGAFFVSLLCGSGGVIHFSVYDPELSARPASVLTGFRKALRIVSPHLGIVLATVPAGNAGLLRLLSRMGFVELAVFDCAGAETFLLKYLKPAPAILNHRNETNQGGTS